MEDPILGMTFSQVAALVLMPLVGSPSTHQFGMLGMLGMGRLFSLVKKLELRE